MKVQGCDAIFGYQLGIELNFNSWGVGRWNDSLRNRALGTTCPLSCLRQSQNALWLMLLAASSLRLKLDELDEYNQ